MCIFSQPVVSVTNTNIFARVLSGGWQNLVYQMNFETLENNAIILPLPVELPAAEESTLEFIDLKDYGDFFDDLHSGFPIERANSRSRSLGIDSAVGSIRPDLVVHEVGDFVASFVPSIADFDRLDEQFRIAPEKWEEIPAYSDYGFAVFQLRTLSGQPHPMAFRFRSRLCREESPTAFFPTVHIHDGEVHSRESFDHSLYLQAPEYDAVCGEFESGPRLTADPQTGYVRSKWLAGEFCEVEKSRGILDGESLVHRIEMRGLFDNTDVVAELQPADVQASLGFSPLYGTAAIACVGGVAGLSWLFNRRNQIAAKTSISNG